MSITKTSIPSLAELTQAIGVIDADNHERPLCANIFDVQRGELLEEYEQLRKAFWEDPTEATTLSDVQVEWIPVLPSTSNLEISLQTDSPLAREHTPLQSYLQPSAPSTTTRTPSPLPQVPFRKRTLSDAQSVVSKRQKVNALQGDTPRNFVKLSPQKAYESLLQLKHLLLLQLKTADGYDESKIISMLTDVKRTKSPEQSRHLAVYLVPVAKAMRRDTITKTLEQWFLIE
ncbi:unnamed protein product [Mucor hiemalis]